jgi:signal transduction histidine kinase
MPDKSHHAEAKSSHPEAGSRRRKVLVAIAIFAIWTVIATLAGLGRLIYRARAGIQSDWSAFFVEVYVDWYTCAVFTPLIFWLSNRFPLARRRLLPHLALHIAATVVFIVLRLALFLSIAEPMGWADPDITFGDQMLRSAFALTLAYWIVLGAGHGLKYYYSQRELERSLAQARLHALKAQIHPHFIFNALNAVATLMHRDVAAADRMVVELGELLRESMQTDGKQTNTVAEELRLVRNYLNIMRIRYGDRLRVEVAAEEGAADALVPQLLLQPIVENALRHGIDESPAASHVAVSAARKGNMLELSVEDDGPGFTAVPPRSGVGLSNTHQRIEQLYDGRGRIVCSNRTQGGARVIVEIPFESAV